MAICSSSMDLISTSARGSRTLVATLDSYAKFQPHKIFHSVPVSSNLEDGFRDIEFRDISHAVDSFAWWLRNNYGPSKDFETVAYLGVNDLRYAVLFFGFIKVGYKAFFISPQNSASQIKHLLEATSCSKFFFSPEHQGKVEQVLDIMPGLSIELVEPLDYWMASYKQHYVFHKPYELAKWDPILVAHSSGCTGSPRPIVLNNGYFAAADAEAPLFSDRQAGGPPLWDFKQGGYHFCPTPMYHLLGFVAAMFFPVFAFSSVNVLAPPDRPVTPALVKDILRLKEIKLLYTDPVLVENLARLDGGLNQLSKLEYLVFAGGPLAEDCGNALVQSGLRLCQTFGATETGGARTLIPNPEDWQYLEFQPVFNFTMELVPGTSVYELVYRMANLADETVAQANKRYRGVDWIFPDVLEYRTKDLFAPHTTKPGLWRYCGRIDDIVISSTGKKVNALDFESVFAKHPVVGSEVAGVLFAGNGRSHPCLLLEPQFAPMQTENAEPEFIESIWPAVQRANLGVPGWAQIRRHMIRLVDVGGLLRPPKGTVIRKASEEKYLKLVNAMYGNELASAGKSNGDTAN